MYEIQEQFLESVLHLNWMKGNGKLAILGGIMVNCDGVGTDRFVPLKFEIRTREQTVDVFEETFGKRVNYPLLNNSTDDEQSVRSSIDDFFANNNKKK